MNLRGETPMDKLEESIQVHRLNHSAIVATDGVQPLNERFQVNTRFAVFQLDLLLIAD